MNLISIVQDTVLAQIGRNCNLLVAYSGGVDSTVLLHALVMLKQQKRPDLQLKAIYIHHGISQHADSWASHCQQQCFEWQIPFIVERVHLDLDLGNVEEQARQARYFALRQHLNNNQLLCTAQHQDDQSETFFLALKRGSGPTGLSAMQALSHFDGYSLLRPLLTISRQQIEQYATSYNLSWIEDESNKDSHYDRNFLRLAVLPILNERWPHFSQMVARSAELCYEQQQLLDELLSNDFAALIDAQHSLLITPLRSASPIKRNALLRMWFKHYKINMPSRKQLDIIWQTVALAKADSNPIFLLDEWQIRRYQGRIYLLPQYQNIQQVEFDWNLQSSLDLPDGLGRLSASKEGLGHRCRLPRAGEKVSVRFHAQGMWHIVGRVGSRQIKKLWQEFGIPSWQRTRIPMVFYNDTLITAVGIFVTIDGQGDEMSYSHQIV